MFKDKRIDKLIQRVEILGEQILSLHNQLKSIMLEFDGMREHIDNRIFDLLTHNIDSSIIEKVELKVKNKFLQQKWLIEDAEHAKVINNVLETKGGKLIDLRKKLHEQYIALNKRGKDTIYIQGQLNILDDLLKGNTNVA